MSVPHPFYSIILPVYNAEQTLEKCLRSIATQDFKDFELIIVDGLSQDTSLEIVSQHRLNFRAVNVVSGKDDNVYHAMNKGAQLATGRWLYFIGADDSLSDTQILSQVHAILSSKPSLDLFYGNVRFSSCGKIYNGKYNFPRLLITNICHQSCFISREAFKRYGPFDQQYKLYADWDLNLKIFRQSKAIAYADMVIAEYNDSSGLSHASNDKAFEEKRIAMKAEYYSRLIPRLQKKFVRLKRLIKKTFLEGKKTQLKKTHLPG